MLNQETAIKFFGHQLDFKIHNLYRLFPASDAKRWLNYHSKKHSRSITAYLHLYSKLSSAHQLDGSQVILWSSSEDTLDSAWEPRSS